MGRVDLHGVWRPNQRRPLTRAVGSVARSEPFGLGGDRLIRRIGPVVEQTAAGSLPNIRDEEDLQRRTRKHHGADVPPVADNVRELSRRRASLEDVFVEMTQADED